MWRKNGQNVQFMAIDSAVNSIELYFQFGFLVLESLTFCFLCMDVIALYKPNGNDDGMRYKCIKDKKNSPNLYI